VNNKVIYTVLTGSYDELKQPRFIHPDFDYICFTDVLNEEYNGVWKLKKIPNIIEDKARLSRYPKMRPDLLLPEYDYSLYIDGNICIQDIDIYTRVLEAIEKKYIWAGVKHPLRDCIYDEGFEVLFARRYETNLFRGLKQMRFLLNEKFPTHYGMYEANIIFRAHKELVIAKQGDLWWNMLLAYSKRDQFALSYTLWKFEIPFRFLLPTHLNSRNYFGVEYQNHNHFSSKFQKKINRFWYIKIYPKVNKILKALYYTLIGYKKGC